MNTAQPIRKTEDLNRIKAYYKIECPHPRNYLLIIMGLNTALRISDLLQLRWEGVYDFKNEEWKEHIIIVEQKTGKNSSILVNSNLKEALWEYRKHLLKEGKNACAEDYIFESLGFEHKSITRIQAFRIIKKAAEACNISGVVSCHSLRKTFGYHAWQQGISPVLLMNIYNHSSFQVTQRYLGIEQDDRDKVFEKIVI
ncbi:MAG: tyrosine-type recombinase/integrase [Lachnospiraceae bacterium]|nr:tyrosine-type recombinase/integrase [Lachnospiraceae bacterium]